MADAPRGTETIDDSHLIEVSKDFFFEGMVLPVGVYLKMKPKTYLVIGKKGDKANIRDLHSFKHPDAKIFVLNLDYPTLISFIGSATTRFVSQKNIPAAIKGKFVSALLTDALDSLAKSGFTSIDKLQKVTQIVSELSKASSEFDEIFKILESMQNEESKHAMSTCMVSMMIAEEMKITQSVVLNKIALGSLLHDVGMKHLPVGLAEKQMHLMTPDELQTFQQHPIKGAEVLRDVKDISMDVLLIVAEHHENAMGLGYPKKQRDIKTSPLAKIVAVGNQMTELMFSFKGGKIYSPDEAVKYIEDVLGQPYNKQVFLALKNILNKKALADKAS